MFQMKDRFISTIQALIQTLESCLPRQYFWHLIWRLFQQTAHLLQILKAMHTSQNAPQQIQRKSNKKPYIVVNV